MSVEFKPVVEDHLVDSEFDVPCCVGGCGATATWSGWAAHNYECCVGYGLLCDKDKAIVEQRWLEAIDSFVCNCGWRCTGQLSDNFRAIRL